MATNYARVIGMKAKDRKGHTLGTLTDIYNDGVYVVCVIDDHFEFVATSLEEVLDIVNGPSASFVRIK